MMTSSRPRDVGGSFSSRRGHANQLSISDPSHHVTEAIGTMYGDGDDDDYGPGPEAVPQITHRPMSFISSPYGDHLEKQQQKQAEQSEERLRLVRSTSDKSGITLNTAANHNGNFPNTNNPLKKSTTLPARIPSQRNSSFEAPKSPMSPMSPLSPSPSLRDVQADAEGSQFPLTNIDNPNDIAQELSNLQALRRMSMDVGNTSDPDLLPFSGLSLMAMPSIAPTGDDDEADPSRLLWVPARVHPELEPTAFKSFLENRVQSMKRRSGESTLSVDGLQRNDAGSLRRKKSMLSRQIDNTNGSGADGYVDGAEKLETEHLAPELSLNELVKDPTKAVKKLAHDSMPEGASEGDMPILPVAPGMGLRRSTRTTYRKGGSLRHGDRAPFSKRVAAARQAERDSTEEPGPVEPPPPRSLARVQSDPVTENYSRPTRSVKRQQAFSRESPSASSAMEETTHEPATEHSASTSSPLHQELPVRTSSQHSSAQPIPQIIETPPPTEDSSQTARPYPQRSSSQKATQQYSDEPPIDGPPARSSRRPAPGRPIQSTPPPSEPPVEQPVSPTAADGSGLNDMANNPSALPGSGNLRTDSLTFIPTLNVSEEKDKKPDRKSKDQDDNDSILSSKSWKWFRTDDKDKKKKKEKEKEKDKERGRDKEKDDQAKKAKTKSFAEKAHDNARLDVLQSSIDTVVSKGRESLLLDRESIDNKLTEERKKESSRKSGEGKKDKDGFFGGLFGGSKRKSDKDPGGKKKENRALSPEPPARILRPDVDYPWTRFTIIEERAIYRMAHIKLANPRRSLQSQVLLSNFMYSYLAKVQAMHPQLQVPISPQQKRQEEERKRREAEQQQLELEQQMAQGGGQDGDFDFEYHRSGNQYGENPQHDGGNQYAEDAHLYEYDHGGEIPDEGASSSHGNGGGYHNKDSYSQHQSRQGNGSQDSYSQHQSRQGNGNQDSYSQHQSRQGNGNQDSYSQHQSRQGNGNQDSYSQHQSRQGGNSQDSYAQHHSRQGSGGQDYYYGHENGHYEDDERDDMW